MQSSLLEVDLVLVLPRPKTNESMRSVRSLLEDICTKRVRHAAANGSAPLFGSCLNAGAEAEHIAAMEERLGANFPTALRELYGFADGQNATKMPK
eukprot:1550450-Amphidinium_carterae.1